MLVSIQSLVSDSPAYETFANSDFRIEGNLLTLLWIMGFPYVQGVIVMLLHTAQQRR